MIVFKVHLLLQDVAQLHVTQLNTKTNTIIISWTFEKISQTNNFKFQFYYLHILSIHRNIQKIQLTKLV